MMTYIIRRCLYAIPILIGINILVFVLFFIVNTPEDMARAHLGVKRTPPEAIDRWLREHGLDVPMFYNAGWKRVGTMDASSGGKAVTFQLSKPGAYRFRIESPSDVEVPGRRLSWNTIPSGAVEPASLTFGSEAKQKVLFDNTSSGGPVEMICRFEVDEQSPFHRIIVEFKDPRGWREAFTETMFFKRSLKMLVFDYGRTDRGENIAAEITSRILPSLSITVPALLVGVFVNILIAMILAVFRGTYVDTVGTIFCVVLMSISAMFYIIGGQWLFGKVLRLVPISGFDVDAFSPRFMILPVAIIVMAGMGAMTRFYRTLFLEELNRPYVQTARAKGVQESRVLFVHVLKNAMIPILTGLVVQLPLLFLGSLLIENFFSIPGMGAYTVEAIQGQDFATVQAMVSLGSFMFIIGLLLTDISYTWVDPRVRLES